MADNKEEQGRHLMKKAEEKLKGWSLFNKKQKYEDAALLYVDAANAFKMAKKNALAAEAYAKAAFNFLEYGSKHDAATQYVNASNILKKTDVLNSVDFLSKAVEIYTDDGRFSIAAKHEKDMAEALESENQLEEALKHYQTASEFYEGEGSNTTANSCLLKVAHISASLGSYDKAIEILEQVAAASTSGPTKWSVKDYLFKAGILHLARGDLVAAKKALERYPEMSVQFGGSREHKFLTQITNAVETYDVEAFTNAVVEFDQITKLDPWMTSLLLKIKQGIKTEDNDLT
jgi:alpha-soluble NSF attachment protein